MVIRKRPKGKARHSRSHLDGGILYTAKKRSATYNDIIPVNEQKKTSFTNQFTENLLSKASRRFLSKNTKNRQSKKTTMVRTATMPLFSDRSIVLCTLICIALIIFALIAIPIAYAKHEVSVNLLDSGRTFTAMTTAKTVGEFLRKNNVSISDQDYLETSASLPIEEGMDIIIRRAMPLSVKTGAETADISMIAGTVSEALNLAGVQVDEDDEVYPALDSYVRSGMSIDYINVDIQMIKDQRTIGYEEETVEDDSLLKGDSEIVQYGEEGLIETQTKQVYKNGVLYSEDIVAETVVKDAVPEIIAFGTKVIKKTTTIKTSDIHSGNIAAGGPSSDQIREIRTMTATAYAGDTTTATGTYPTIGTVAANPNELPYGTKLYIVGYGYGRVEDTGGFINSSSNTIDLFMNSEAECNAWGRQSVTVYILN